MAFTFLDITAAHIGTSVLFDCADITIEQKFNPSWNNTPSYGKMDGIPAYSNTTRKIDFNFTAMGTQRMSAKQMNQNIDTLTKMQYPRYKPIGTSAQRTFAGAPFFIVKYYVEGKAGKSSRFPEFHGYIESLTIAPGHKSKQIPVSDGTGTVLYESKFVVIFSLVVMHETLPGWTETGDFTSTNGFYFAEGTPAGGTNRTTSGLPNNSYDADQYDPNSTISAARQQRAAAPQDNGGFSPGGQAFPINPDNSSLFD